MSRCPWLFWYASYKDHIRTKNGPYIYFKFLFNSYLMHVLQHITSLPLDSEDEFENRPSSCSFLLVCLVGSDDQRCKYLANLLLRIQKVSRQVTGNKSANIVGFFFFFFCMNFAGGRGGDAAITKRNEWQAALVPSLCSPGEGSEMNSACWAAIGNGMSLFRFGKSRFCYLSEGGMATEEELQAAWVWVVFIT